MKYLMVIALSLTISLLHAQKPVLDSSAIAEWPTLNGEQISNDGQYVLYFSDEKTASGLFIRSIADTFEMRIPEAKNASFTEDGKRVVFLCEGDSLGILELKKRHVVYIPFIKSYRMPMNGNGKWLAYLSISYDLVLCNLYTGEKKIFPNVFDYSFSESGMFLLSQSLASNKQKDKRILKCIDVESGNAASVWQGDNIINTCFDKTELQLAFIVKRDHTNWADNEIWYFKKGMNSAILLVNSKTPMMEEDGLTVANDPLKFSADGHKLFFVSHRQENLHTNADMVSMDIWNYRDKFLQSEQLRNLETEKNRPFLGVFNLGNKKILRLEADNDGIFDINYRVNSNYLVTQTIANYREFYYLPDALPDIYLVNIDDGSHKCIRKQLVGSDPHFSMGGKYILWYDSEKRAYYTYNIKTAEIKNISAAIPFPINDETYDRGDRKKTFTVPYDAAVFVERDNGLLLYDKYDIWQVDLDGSRAPINITNGYGRRNKIILRYVYKEGRDYTDEPAIGGNEDLLLCSLNETTKQNGFFRKKIGETGDPVQLCQTSDVYYFSKGISFVSFPTTLHKAKQANVWLLRRKSATEYDNLVVTKDFKSFNAISSINPQKKYNWLTTELVKWKTFKGYSSEGILYKPENFDSLKKYPIIFHFYERVSAGLNEFLKPEWSFGPINIPFYVSHGYLVFCPDIYYTIGQPGESVFDYVISIATLMSNKSWVDKYKMSIQGHSWGGYEVNYLLTNTSMFAAAVSAAGASDLVSRIGTLKKDGADGHGWVETGQYRMGVPLWQDQIGYIKNSPIFNADKVSTPLLIMHNKEDGAVPWSQGTELFTGLRRLSKPCWMLQYDGMDHNLAGTSCRDYSIRLTQFFDHYLKDAPAPIWMTKGIPAKLKQIETGYTYDPSGNCGKDCKVCKEWNEKMKKDSAATWKEIERRKVEEHWE